MCTAFFLLKSIVIIFVFLPVLMKDVWDICHINKYELIEIYRRIPSLLLVAAIVGFYQLTRQQIKKEAKKIDLINAGS